MKDGEGVTPLIAAAMSNSRSIVELLREKGANPNIAGHRGVTSLRMAANSGEVGIIDALIRAGADINAKDELGVTPLHGAARKNHREAFEFLVAKGANPKAKDCEGRTSAKYAELSGRSELAVLIGSQKGKGGGTEKSERLWWKFW